MGATNKKSKKSAGFAKRKRQTKRPLQRTGKHKKSAPHVKNLAALVSKDKGDRRAIAIEYAKKARERSAKPSHSAKNADAAAPDAMEESDSVLCVAARVRAAGPEDLLIVSKSHE